MDILLATLSFFSLPGTTLAHLSHISEIVFETPETGMGTPFTTARPIANSRFRSLCQFLFPLTTNEPRASVSPVSVVFETWLDLAWKAVAAAPPLPHALDQHTATCAASLRTFSGSPLAASMPSPRFWTIWREATPSGTLPEGFLFSISPSLSFSAVSNTHLTLPTTPYV